MRVALVHDWLTGLRGGERVLHQLVSMFPTADLYTLLHVRGNLSEEIERLKIYTSPLDGIPGISRHYRKLLPLFPWAIGRFYVQDYDLILSTHHAVAKAIPHHPDIPHLCYCFTPMRYVWDQIDLYLGRGLRRVLSFPLAHYMRRFDRKTSQERWVDRFVGISEGIVRRIASHYGRKAGLVYPPVDVDRFYVASQPGDYYLLVGGFTPYKREDVAVDAFRGLGRRLVVVGDGPDRLRREKSSPSNVEFTGRVSDLELADLYAGCRALIYPQEEDFGIVPLEAQASGKPVIALGRGGATETVIPLTEEEENATGIWFENQDPVSLRLALKRFEKEEHRFDPFRIRAHAELFRPERFHHEMNHEIEVLLSGMGKTRDNTESEPPR